MAQKGAKPTEFQPRPDAYVPSYMEKGDVAAFEEWLDERRKDGAWAPLLLEVLGGDFELKVLSRSGGWTALLHDKQREEAERYFILTAWASTPSEALLLVLWKHFEQTQQDWVRHAMGRPEKPKYR